MCPHQDRQRWYGSLKKDLRQHCDKLKTDPAITDLLLYGLEYHLCGSPIPEHLVLQHLHSIIHHQSTIGWPNFSWVVGPNNGPDPSPLTSPDPTPLPLSSTSGQCGRVFSSGSYRSTATKNGSLGHIEALLPRMAHKELSSPRQRPGRPHTNTNPNRPTPNPSLVHPPQQMSCRWATKILLPRYRHTLRPRTSHPKP
jgi:hypothetical protein